MSLSQLRSVTMSWVEENFSDYEVAVVYHDDNEHRVPHAHVIVNNTNLVTGRRLQDPDPRALKRSAQRIAGEMGLSRFSDRLGRASERDSDVYMRQVDKLEFSGLKSSLLWSATGHKSLPQPAEHQRGSTVARMTRRVAQRTGCL